MERFSKLNDRPLFPLLSVRQLFLVSSSTPKPSHFLCYSPLLLILILFLIGGDIHPDPGPLDPCSVCSRRVTWGNRSVQCTNCSLWLHLSYSVLYPADFRKISQGHSWTCPMCPSSSQPPSSLSHPKPVSSSTNTPKTPSSSTNTHKPISSKMKPPQNNSPPLITPPTLLITPN